MNNKKSIQTTLFGEPVKNNTKIRGNCGENILIDEELEDMDEFKVINIDEFVGEHKCPRCGFEWNE